MIHTAYIGIGSNMGRRTSNINKALDLLAHTEGIALSSLSPFYESEAWGTKAPSGQRSFINAAARIETSASPERLLRELLSVELLLGRKHPREKGEPRTIDLDLLFFDDMAIDLDDLIVPHPEIPKRLFVLTPLCDIAPTLVHPGLGKTIEELEAACRERSPMAITLCSVSIQRAGRRGEREKR